MHSSAKLAPSVEPEPMEDHGAYDRNSRVQASSLSSALPLLSKAAETVPLESLGPIVVVDYGCSAGHTSLEPMRVAVEVLRQRADRGRPISVVHNDLPGNDFSALFNAILNDEGSYLRNDPDAYPSAVGRSFYGMVVPPETVTLGWTSWSVQWLSRVPARISDQVQVAYSRDPSVRGAYARQAAEDWVAFLSARDRELRSGGRLVVLTMASDDAGRFGYRLIVESIYNALLDLVADGFLRRSELDRMAIPTYGRTRAEFLAPFDDAGHFGNLFVESAEIFAAEDRIWAETSEGRDAQVFGARWAQFSRASVVPTLASALDSDTGEARRAAFFDRMEAAMTRRIAAAPEKSLIPLAKLVFVKS